MIVGRYVEAGMERTPFYLTSNLHHCCHKLAVLFENPIIISRLSFALNHSYFRGRIATIFMLI